jgi:exosortase
LSEEEPRGDARAAATSAAAAAGPGAGEGPARDRQPPPWAAFGAIGLALAVYSPILYYMVLHWKIVPDYSHGFLIVPLALYFAWQRRAQLARARLRGSWWGIVPLALGLVSLAIGRLGVELTAMRESFVLSLIGLVLLLFGREVFRILAFPLLFLFLMVPLPQSLVNVVAFPLQLMAASAAVQALHTLHVPALLEGNIIHLADAELFVDQACSGLRSLMALVTLGVCFAYFFRKTAIERVLIVASAIPIAILVNAVRVALTGILTDAYGEQMASGVIHEFQGFITFSMAFLLLMAEARLFDWLRPALLRLAWPGGQPA